MTNNEATIWGIHARKTSDADTLFLKKKYVEIGWFLMGNLKADREAFKVRVAEVYPDSPDAHCQMPTILKRIRRWREQGC